MELDEEPPSWLSNMPSVEPSLPAGPVAQPAHADAVQLK